MRVIALLVVTLALLAAPAGKSQADVAYVVQPGDSLSAIAQRFLGDESRWPELLAANRAVVRENNYLITVGQTLTIPGINPEDVDLPPVAAVPPAQAQTGADGTVQLAPLGFGQIELVTGNDYAPFTDEQLDSGGMLAEVVTRAFEMMDEKPIVEFLGWDPAYRLTERGKFHGTFPWYHNDERARSFYYSEPLFDVLILAFTMKDAGITYTGAEEDLVGLRLCRPDGYFTHDLDQLIADNVITLSQPERVVECFQMLRDGQIDLVTINEFTGMAEITRQGWTDEISAHEQAMAVQSLHMIFPKATRTGRTLTYRFNEALAALDESGELNEIIQRHIQAYYDSLEAEAG